MKQSTNPLLVNDEYNASDRLGLGQGDDVYHDGDKDLFVHHSEIKSDGDFSSLSDGQSVQFEVGEGPKGPCAVNVNPL